jgi:bacillithiol synthase
MKTVRHLDIRTFSPEHHSGYGPGNIISRIHAGTVPASLPLFDISVPVPSSPPVLSRHVLKHLADYNRRIGNPFSEALAGRLQNGARLVIAGQQPGLLLGPMYTFWKLVSAVNLAQTISKTTGTDTVPAFWIASEDHDILEVNRVVIGDSEYVADPGFQPVRGRLRPVGCVSLEKHRDPLLSFLRTQLAGKPFTDRFIELLAACDFTTYSTLFATLMVALLRNTIDWVCIDALDIRHLTSPVLAGAVARHDALDRALKRGGDMLAGNGFKPALHDCGVFEIEEDNPGARIKCAFTSNGMTCSMGNLSLPEAAAFIRENPGRFSAGAALRPILQDAIFPVMTTVCGPSEMLYLWQIDPVYRELEVVRSYLHPRITATVLLPSHQRLLSDTLDLSVIFGSPEKKVPLNREPGEYSVDTHDLNHLETLKKTLVDRLESLDGIDPLMFRKAARAFDHHISKIRVNVLQKRQRATGVDPKYIDRLRRLLMPGNKPQERVLNVCEVLAEWGPDWIDRVFETVSPFQTAHQVITTKTQEDTV